MIIEVIVACIRHVAYSAVWVTYTVRCDMVEGQGWASEYTGSTQHLKMEETYALPRHIFHFKPVLSPSAL